MTKNIFLGMLLLLSSVLNAQKVEFSSFECDGTGKENGLAFKVKYPKNWSSKLPDRPYIVRKFLSDNKAVGLMIEIKKLEGGSLKKEDIDLLHTKEALYYSIGDYNFSNVDYNQKIDGIRTTKVEFNLINKRLDYEIYMKSLMYVLYYKDYQIKLHFTTQGLKKNKKMIDLKFEVANHVFKQMANSFVITSQWK